MAQRPSCHCTYCSPLAVGLLHPEALFSEFFVSLPTRSGACVVTFAFLASPLCALALFISCTLCRLACARLLPLPAALRLISVFLHQPYTLAPLCLISRSLHIRASIHLSHPHNEQAARPDAASRCLSTSAQLVRCSWRSPEVFSLVARPSSHPRSRSPHPFRSPPCWSFGLRILPSTASLLSRCWCFRLPWFSFRAFRYLVTLLMVACVLPRYLPTSRFCLLRPQGCCATLLGFADAFSPTAPFCGVYPFRSTRPTASASPPAFCSSARLPVACLPADWYLPARLRLRFHSPSPMPFSCDALPPLISLTTPLIPPAPSLRAPHAAPFFRTPSFLPRRFRQAPLVSTPAFPPASDLCSETGLAWPWFL